MLTDGTQITPSAVRDWCEETKSRVATLSPEIAQRYADPALYEHYCRTAQLFGSQLQDNVLTYAAFLHGVWDSKWIRDWLDLPQEVRDIIDDRRRLLALAPHDADVPSHLIADVFPKLRSRRSVVLLVIEQLDHLDATGSFRDFARHFRRNPSGRPEAPLLIPQASFAAERDQVAYLRILNTAAQSCGLWFERNLADDLALYHREQRLFDRLVDFVCEDRTRSETKRRSTFVRELVPDLEVAWEWHHVGSLARALGPDSALWSQRLSVAGMVTIVCKDPAECYKTLARLHLRDDVEHQTRDIEDFVGSSSNNGYEAIHTALLPDSGNGNSGAIRIRIITDRSQKLRSEPISIPIFGAAQERLRTRDTQCIVVFAHDGKPISLPIGSTILNFCYEVHSHFVATARQAFVNRIPVDLLTRLEDGDVVRIELGPGPRPLPRDWRNSVAPGTGSKIAKAFRASYRPKQVEAGRLALRAALTTRVPTIALDDDSLDSLLQTVAVQLSSANEATIGTDPAVWLRQFADVQRGTVAWQLLETCADRVADELRRSDVLDEESLTIPKHLHAAFDRIERCATCRPTIGQNVGALIIERRLVIHVLGRPCSVHAEPIEWQKRFGIGHYWTVEMVNRVGIASDLLNEVARVGIDVIDHVGASLGPGWAVLRIHVRALSMEKNQILEQGLRNVPGVLRILTPTHPVIPILEGVLPARTRPKAIAAVETPFVCGDPVSTERFYGRADELHELRRAFQTATSADARRGVGVFVRGPFKVGKTSLVDEFLRELQREQYKTTVVSLTARPLEGWSAFERRLCLEAAKGSVSGVAGHQGTVQSQPDNCVGVVESALSDTSRSFVIFIDEAVHLFGSAAAEGTLHRAIDVFETLRSLPRTLVICAGPESHFFALPESTLNILRGWQQLSVAPLHWKDVKQLLCAEKLGARGLRIRLHDSLARSICNYLGGNPYWANILAKAMLDATRHLPLELMGDASVRRYRHEHFVNAKAALIGFREAFRDRLNPPSVLEQDASLPRRVLVILARTAGQTSDGQRRGLSTDAVIRELHTEIQSVHGSSVADTLACLLSQGSVRVSTERSEAVWEIDCGALADHVMLFQPAEEYA
jgi:hypothetical protein